VVGMSGMSISRAETNSRGRYKELEGSIDTVCMYHIYCTILYYIAFGSL